MQEGRWVPVYHTLKVISNNLYWFMAFRFFLAYQFFNTSKHVKCDILEDRHRYCHQQFFCFFIYKKKKQGDYMLPCICSVIDHRRSQNVVKISVTHWPNRLCHFFCFYHIWCNLWSITKTDTTTTQTKYIKLIYSFVH